MDKSGHWKTVLKVTDQLSKRHGTKIIDLWLSIILRLIAEQNLSSLSFSEKWRLFKILMPKDLLINHANE